MVNEIFLFLQGYAGYDVILLVIIRCIDAAINYEDVARR